MYMLIFECKKNHGWYNANYVFNTVFYIMACFNIDRVLPFFIQAKRFSVFYRYFCLSL